MACSDDHVDAFGWVVVRASRSDYVGAEFDDLDALDDRLTELDEEIWRRTRERLESLEDPWFHWQFFEHLNNATGVLQFCTNRNHRTSGLWEFLDWVVAHAPGAYGLVHVHDDEDLVGVHGYGRGDVDHSNEFRVWRILNGTLEEFADTLLSPFVPTVNPTEWA